MNGKTYINGDELTALANSLKAKSENILSTYKGDCSQAIQMSSECLQLSGLNTTEFFQALEKIYTQVNERIAAFADFLTNVVVAEYNAVSEAITNSFNTEFAMEISNLLGIGVISSIGPIIAPAIPGRPIPLEPTKPIINPVKPVPLKPIQPTEPIYTIQPVQPKPGVKDLSDLKPIAKEDEIIKLDPREWDGTFNGGNKIISREDGNASPVPVYLDDNGTAIAATPEIRTGAVPAVEPKIETISSTISSVKPDLPPLPTKPSSGSVSVGGYSYGGGGGGNMAAAIALDSMSNPLRKLK